MMPKTDVVNHPSHYTSHPSGVECIVITEHFNFCIGNAIKYLWRAGLKDDRLEDLKKARWYVDREIQRWEGKNKTWYCSRQGEAEEWSYHSQEDNTFATAENNDDEQELPESPTLLGSTAILYEPEQPSGSGAGEDVAFNLSGFVEGPWLHNTQNLDAVNDNRKAGDWHG